jgi:hypothetical protein
MQGSNPAFVVIIAAISTPETAYIPSKIDREVRSTMPGPLTPATFFGILTSGGLLTWILQYLAALSTKKKMEPIERLKAEADGNDALASRYEKQLASMEILIVEARQSAAEARRDASEAWTARRGIENLLIDTQKENAELRRENVRLNAKVEELSEEVHRLQSQLAGHEECPHCGSILIKISGDNATASGE